MLIKIGDAWIDPEEIAMINDSYDSHLEAQPQICIHLRHGSGTWIHSTMDEAEAALIDAGVIEDPAADVDKLELTEAEHAAVEALYNDGFHFLARDADGKLYAFDREPHKEGAYWDNDPDPGQPKPKRVDEGFDFIDFDDEDPWSIAYLLLE